MLFTAGEIEYDGMVTTQFRSFNQRSNADLPVYTIYTTRGNFHNKDLSFISVIKFPRSKS